VRRNQCRKTQEKFCFDTNQETENTNFNCQKETQECISKSETIFEIFKKQWELFFLLRALKRKNLSLDKIQFPISQLLQTQLQTYVQPKWGQQKWCNQIYPGPIFEYYYIVDRFLWKGIFGKITKKDKFLLEQNLFEGVQDVYHNECIFPILLFYNSHLINFYKYENDRFIRGDFNNNFPLAYLFIAHKIIQFNSTRQSERNVNLKVIIGNKFIAIERLYYFFIYSFDGFVNKMSLNYVTTKSIRIYNEKQFLLCVNLIGDYILFICRQLDNELVLDSKCVVVTNYNNLKFKWLTENNLIVTFYNNEILNLNKKVAAVE
jgi:hypothetical protein